MEGHSDMGVRGESSNNIVIGGPGEDQSKSRHISDNINCVSRDELDSLHGESSKKRKCIRHNSHQVQELEVFFKENPHPDPKAMLELGIKLSMDCNQVKFWFQNRKKQVKSRWIDIFSCIVGNTSTFDVISSGIGGSRSGTLLLIQTEFQIISDLVPVREIKFLRFCHQLPTGIWVVVDVPVDTIQEGSCQCKIGNCRRLPSGCIVQDMPNGYSKVTWIEHMEYNENFIPHIYRPLVRIGLGFGAQRCIANLKRQSEFMELMMSPINATCGHAVCPSRKKSIWMLAKRMTRNFCTGVCPTVHKWKPIQLAKGQDAKLMMRKSIGDPGEPIGVVLSATKTIWLPVKQQRLFEFFMNAQRRSQWDVLSSSCPMQQMVYNFKHQNLDSSISLFRANGDDTSANQNMFILQENHRDATGSLLVNATIDSIALNVVMNGGDSSCVALLPSGIAIVPACFHDYSGANNCNGTSGQNDNDICRSGSLVTIGFQVLVNSSPTAKFSMESTKTVNDLISRKIHDIATAFKCK